MIVIIMIIIIIIIIIIITIIIIIDSKYKARMSFFNPDDGKQPKTFGLNIFNFF